MIYVSRYGVTRHYGGPEEGGWWYDRYKWLGAVRKTHNEGLAIVACRELNKQAKEDKLQPAGNYQGRFSVADPTDQVYMVESTLGEHDDSNEPRPHYE